MNGRLSFGARFMRVLLPTRVQLLGSTFIALAILVFSESANVIQRLGVSSDALKASQTQLQNSFSGITHSLLVANVALVIFWSFVGLVAYLICWAGYNFLIEARNELTVETQYKNLGGFKGPWVAIAVKLVAGVALASVLASFRFVLGLALAMVAPLIAAITPSSVFLAIGGLCVLTLGLYLIVACFELVFSAWYRPEAFTEE